MKKDKIRQFVAFVLTMLIVLSMLYIVYWKYKILFKH